jgi:hypothetical protein
VHTFLQDVLVANVTRYLGICPIAEASSRASVRLLVPEKVCDRYLEEHYQSI